MGDIARKVIELFNFFPITIVPDVSKMEMGKNLRNQVTKNYVPKFHKTRAISPTDTMLS